MQVAVVPSPQEGGGGVFEAQAPSPSCGFAFTQAAGTGGQVSPAAQGGGAQSTHCSPGAQSLSEKHRPGAGGQEQAGQPFESLVCAATSPWGHTHAGVVSPQTGEAGAQTWMVFPASS